MNNSWEDDCELEMEDCGEEIEGTQELEHKTSLGRPCTPTDMPVFNFMPLWIQSPLRICVEQQYQINSAVTTLSLTLREEPKCLLFLPHN